MPLVSFQNVSLAYGDVPLLDHVSFTIEPGERLALIGRNGTGKSSLIRLLVGQGVPDDGLIARQPGLTLGHVPQEPDLGQGRTVFEVVCDGLGDVVQLLAQYAACTVALEKSSDAKTLERFDQITAQLDAQGGWQMQSRIAATLARLALDGARSVDELSGGQRKRVALARALVADPDLLVLDEPTNHLDIESIIWLEELLRDYAGSILFVTHDRTFLDRVSTRVLELDRGLATDFPGSFTAYQQRKADQLAVEAVAAEKFDRLLAQEEVWIRKGIEARRTRNEGRVRRLEQLRRDRAARRERVGRVNLGLEMGSRSGELVAELTEVSKSYGGRAVVEGFSCRVLRGDKLGLVGPNGSGKTTLLRLLLGEVEPDSGVVRQGTRLNVAYYDQFRQQLDDGATLAEVISPGSEFVDVGGVRKHVISYLGDFLFSPQRARAKVSALSGGERNRLLLARIFAQPANLVVLDEPTNDLDLDTLDILEDLLQDYPGTVLLVSHDRTFLDNVVTQVIASEGEGRWVENPGGYGDWLAIVRARASTQQGLVATPGEAAGGKSVRGRRRAAKLSFSEERDLAALPGRLDALEHEQKTLGGRLSDPGLYRDDPVEVKRLKARFDAIEAEMLTGLARWEELEAKRSGAEVDEGT